MTLIKNIMQNKFHLVSKSYEYVGTKKHHYPLEQAVVLLIRLISKTMETTYFG